MVLSLNQKLEVDEEAGKGDVAEAVPLANAPLWALEIANIVAFAANFYAVSLGGRVDGSDDAPTTLNYLSPAGYAFLIWPAIYLSEAMFLGWMVVKSFCASDKWKNTIRALTPGWIAGNLFQVLWCVFYRPRFATFGLLWISFLMLSSIAISLSFAHGVAVSRAETIDDNVFMIGPISLHFGWTTAASLVNLNNWVSTGEFPRAVGTLVLFTSLVLAGVIGVGLAVHRGATVYGMTIAWAVIAVSVYTFQSSAFKDEFGVAGAFALGSMELVLGVSLVGVCIYLLAVRIQMARA